MTAEQTPQVDSRAYRNTIGLFASGVTVVTTRLGEIIHGMTANAISSVSLDPTLLLICLDRRTRMHDLIQQAGVFAVNILATDQEHLSGHFAGRSKDGPPPAGLHFVYGTDGTDDGGAPTIAGSVAAIRCQVEAVYLGGDHTILLGRVTELRPGAADAQPLIWYGGRYRHLTAAVSTERTEPEPWWEDQVQAYYREWDAPAPKNNR
jgi:flavin reductase (DIM6/NTAB) family NADH-FMN oxidoreductase RutF